MLNSMLKTAPTVASGAAHTLSGRRASRTTYASFNLALSITVGVVWLVERYEPDIPHKVEDYLSLIRFSSLWVSIM